MVRVELWPLGHESRKRELGRMTLTNRGDHPMHPKRGNYTVNLMRKGEPTTIQRAAEVQDHPRESYSIWKLVQKALNNVLEIK